MLLSYMKVIQEIRERFSVVNVAPIKGFYCIPTIMPNSKTWKVKLGSFMGEYIDDMVDSTSLDAEIDLWGNLWLNSQAELPQNVKEVLERKPKSGFANVNQVLHLLAVLPVTTCSCERSISAMKRIKTYLRSTMHQVIITVLQYFIPPRKLRPFV